MLSIIDHGCHIQVSWLHFTRNCHIYPNRPSIHSKCITYGSLSIWLHNQTLHQHSIHMLSHNSPWIPHASIMAYTSPVIVISIQIDHQFTRNISHMVSMELDYIINHHCQYSIHMLSLIHHRFHMQASCFTFHPYFAISIQIDLQFTRNVSPMVSGALDYTIDLSHQYSHSLLSHNWHGFHMKHNNSFHP